MSDEHEEFFRDRARRGIRGEGEALIGSIAVEMEMVYDRAFDNGAAEHATRLDRALVLLKETQDKVMPPGIAWTEKVEALLKETDHE